MLINAVIGISVPRAPLFTGDTEGYVLRCKARYFSELNTPKSLNFRWTAFEGCRFVYVIYELRSC